MPGVSNGSSSAEVAGGRLAVVAGTGIIGSPTERAGAGNGGSPGEMAAGGNGLRYHFFPI